MDNDLTLITQKLDQLSAQVETQQQQLALLVGLAEKQQRQLEEFQELKRDVAPIVNHMVKLTIDELAEVGTEFQAEDLFFLLKRTLRDTRMIVEGLDRLEMMMDLYDESQRVGKQIFSQAVTTLDRLERDGYFDFARGGWRIAEKVVSEFSPEDLQSLGDNLTPVLTTVKRVTRPEFMTLANNLLDAVQSDPAGGNGKVSLWRLLKDLGDPKVRNGMARLLNLLKALADQPEGAKNQGNGR